MNSRSLQITHAQTQCGWDLVDSSAFSTWWATANVTQVVMLPAANLMAAIATRRWRHARANERGSAMDTATCCATPHSATLTTAIAKCAHQNAREHGKATASVT
jgi:hypothetical protein